MKKTIHIVPHSHWDREWYFTLNDSNLMLAENMQHLLAVLEKNPDFPAYVFDGQYSVIDAYLQWHPEDKQRIASLVQAKRLFIGPWYTQADTRLIHHESLIRNLLYGTTLSKAMGHSMEIGYLPDTFGQNAYLPSIFQEFSIKYSILQRGIYTKELTTNDVNFHWQSPDGRTVAANYLYFGYGPGKFLDGTQTYLEEHLSPLLSKLDGLNANSNNLLLPAGGDQVLVREIFPDIVRTLNTIQTNYHFKLSNYECFMKETWKQNNFTTVIKNERMASEKSRIHRTIASQRYDIKQLNSRLEHKLIQMLEPLLVFVDALAIFSYPKKQLDTIWKVLFDVHAHDSIGGCNSDATNQSIKQRLIETEQLIDGLQNIALKKLGATVVDASDNNMFFLFNSLVKEKEEDVRLSLFSLHSQIQVCDAETKELIPLISVDREYIDGGTSIKMTAEGEQAVPQPGYYKHTIILKNVQMQALYYRVFKILSSPDMVTFEESKECAIENETIRIDIHQNTVRYTNKKTNDVIENMLQFEDTADAGDSYDYSPLDGASAIFSTLLQEKTTIVEANTYSTLTCYHQVSVPYDLDHRFITTKMETLEIQTKLTITTDSNQIEISHTLENTALDHRIRVLLKGAHPFIKNTAKQAFGIIERELDTLENAKWQVEKYAEIPINIHVLDQFMTITDTKNNNIGIVSRDIKEYQILDKELIALTLFRSVGVLGKDDLVWRPGRASGINNKVIYTPDAQMQQKMTFTYSINYQTNDSVQVTDYEKRLASITSYQLQKLNTFEMRLDRFELPLSKIDQKEHSRLLEISNQHIIQSIVKKAEDDSGYIVRVYNATSQTQTTALVCGTGWTVYESDLSEKTRTVISNTISFKPNEYITIKLTKTDVS